MTTHENSPSYQIRLFCLRYDADISRQPSFGFLFHGIDNRGREIKIIAKLSATIGSFALYIIDSGGQPLLNRYHNVENVIDALVIGETSASKDEIRGFFERETRPQVAGSHDAQHPGTFSADQWAYEAIVKMAARRWLEEDAGCYLEWIREAFRKWTHAFAEKIRGEGRPKQS